MKLIYILAALVFVVGIILSLFKKTPDRPNKEKLRYQYERKDFFMSRAEHECFNALLLSVGDTYHVFPQVHLSSMLNHEVKGQNWKGAFNHINEKSVDFVLCDKSYLAPKLAIELDDKSHEKTDRILRDREVEQIFLDANLPLLRLENHGSFNPTELASQINSLLPKN